MPYGLSSFDPMS
ncbi:hypothetical protein C352_00885 [Cryptococcus neoformans CHC193]|nr:hypothetical protein C352_00887 [Cryptococcus neoformans var. grubii CHC193]OXG71964.1 hypothetical protein C352_00885 [Cryptococcus neoformans var. grubii CHC193]